VSTDIDETQHPPTTPEELEAFHFTNHCGAIRKGWLCTRRKHIDSLHIAGRNSSRMIVATWREPYLSGEEIEKIQTQLDKGILDRGSSAGGASRYPFTPTKVPYKSPVQEPCAGTTADGRPCARIGGHTVCIAWVCSSCEHGFHHDCTGENAAFTGRVEVNPSVAMKLRCTCRHTTSNSVDVLGLVQAASALTTFLAGIDGHRVDRWLGLDAKEYLHKLRAMTSALKSWRK
jgi:hypothetical protein